jgi:hypothetical protein
MGGIGERLQSLLVTQKAWVQISILILPFVLSDLNPIKKNGSSEGRQEVSAEENS